MATAINLKKAFATGNGVAGGAANYFTFAQDHDSNYTAIETTVNALVSEVSAVQGPNALLPLDILQVNDPLHAGGTKLSGVVGEHSFKSAIGAPTSNLNVARGQAVIGSTRVNVASDTVLAGSGGAGTRWVNVSTTGAVTLQTSAGTGGLDVASWTWSGAAFTGSATQLAEIFFDGDEYDLMRNRAAAGGGTPAFPAFDHRTVAQRIREVELFLAGIKSGASVLGGTMGALGFGGSAATPGMVLTDGTTFDLTTGLFRAAANILGISVSASEVVRFAAAQVLASIAGSAGTPWLSRAGDPDTGIYFPGADQIAVAAGATEAALFRETAANVISLRHSNRLRIRASNAALALATGTALTNLTTATEEEDIGGWHSGTSADHTAPTNSDGLYLITAGVRFIESSAGGANQNTGNTRRIALTVNGTEIPNSGTLIESRGNNALTEDMRLVAFAVHPLVATDVVRVAAAQDSGASMNVDVNIRIIQIG